MERKNKLRAYERNRIIYGAAIVIVVLLGLGSRHYSAIMPKLIADYAGDTLWSLTVFLGLGFIFKKWPTLKVGVISLAFSFVIELSQLYHSLWIDAIRRTSLGSLVLGFGFLWSDLICYIIGITAGVLIEKLITCRVRS
jgi:hypothetical protein